MMAIFDVSQSGGNGDGDIAQGKVTSVFGVFAFAHGERDDVCGGIDIAPFFIKFMDIFIGHEDDVHFGVGLADEVVEFVESLRERAHGDGEFGLITECLRSVVYLVGFEGAVRMIFESHDEALGVEEVEVIDIFCVSGRDLSGGDVSG